MRPDRGVKPLPPDGDDWIYTDKTAAHPRRAVPPPAIAPNPRRQRIMLSDARKKKIIREIAKIYRDTDGTLARYRHYHNATRTVGCVALFVAAFLLTRGDVAAWICSLLAFIGGVGFGLGLWLRLALVQTPLLVECTELREGIFESDPSSSR